jgi:hypothetical protein
MDDKGRIVVVAAGFALWLGGRCIAAARWADVRTLRGVAIDPARPDHLALRVELLDGTLIELREEAPGFDLFLDRASVTLAGMLPFKSWHPALADGTAPATGLLVFERPAKRPSLGRR